MADLIIIAVIVIILAVAIGYILKKKQSGASCIGCPDGSCCPHSKGGCSCHCKK